MDEQMQAREIERVVRLERMMTRAYDIAMSKIQEPDLVEILAPFRERHRKSARAIEQIARRPEADALELDQQFRDYLEEVLGTIQDSVRRDEALGELRVAEAGLKAAYGQALDAVSNDRQKVLILKERLSDESEHVRVLAMAHETSRA